MATNKKEAFRQYLEAAGVLDTITKSQLAYCLVTAAIKLLTATDKLLLNFIAVLVSLYEEPERPKNAIE